MRHQYYEILVSAMIDNNLSEEEKSILDNHIVKCSKCQKIKREFKNISALINGESTTTKSGDFIFTKQKPFASVLKIAATIISIFLFGIASFVGIRQYQSNDINYATISSLPNVSDDKESDVENQELTALIDDRVILTTFSSYFETEENSEDGSQLFSTYFTYINE